MSGAVLTSGNHLVDDTGGHKRGPSRTEFYASWLYELARGGMRWTVWDAPGCVASRAVVDDFGSLVRVQS